MANGFSITIGAVDSASSVIDGVNKHLASLHAPAQRLGKQLSTFSRLSGLQDVGKGFERVARGAYSAFQNVARVVAPLSAITSAASVAGMFKMVDAWGQWGSQLGWAAQNLNVSAGSLQAMQGAAQLAGGSADDLTQGMQGLAQTMYDAIGGRAPEAVAMFNALGIAFDDGTRHIVPVDKAFKKLADSIVTIKDPLTQLRVLTRAGISPSLLPMLRLGSKGIEDLEEKSRRYGATSAAGIATANRMRVAQTDLTLAANGFGNAISERVAPAMIPLLEWMADLITKNRNWIALDAGKYAKQFADYIKAIDFKAVGQGFDTFATKANNVATAFGGWQRVLEGLFLVKSASWAASIIAPFASVLRLLTIVPGSGVTAAELAAVGIADYAVGNVGTQGNVREDHSTWGKWIYDHSSALRYADNYLNGTASSARMDTPTSEVQQSRVAKAFATFEIAGYTPAQSSGPAANMMAESSMNPFAVNGSHFGIGQWDPTRQADFAKLYGHTMQSVTDPDAAFQEQLKFYRYELTQGKYRDVGNAMRSVTSGFQSGSLISQHYEIPNDPTGSTAYQRGGLAQSLFDQFGNLSPSAPAVTSDQSPSTPSGSGAPGPNGADGATGKVAVTISAPPGVKVSARSSGNVLPPKIARTGVGVSSDDPYAYGQ